MTVELEKKKKTGSFLPGWAKMDTVYKYDQVEVLSEEELKQVHE